MPSSMTGYVTVALRHPTLVPGMLRAAWRFRAREWWRRPPFLPLPPRSYMEWRDHTAYGDEARRATPDELERYLHWTELMNR